MKKITLLFALALLTLNAVFAQEAEEEKGAANSYISIGAIAGEGIGYYAFLETYVPFKNMGNVSFFLKGSNVYDVTVTNGWDEVKGKGGMFAIGSRSYFSKNTGRGIFYANEIKYSYIKFDDHRYSGRYSYFSFFAPELGWKIMFGKSKSFGLELSGGVDWAIEIKGKGDVDNKIFDNWKPKASLGIGYNFN